MKEAVSTNNAPKAIGPYSQAIRAGDFLFVSGQLPIDPRTGAIAAPDAAAQAGQSLANIKAILEAAGMGMGDVVKTNVFLKNMGDFAKVNEVYAGFFDGVFPARAAVEVARLPKDALVEIEAVAFKG